MPFNDQGQFDTSENYTPSPMQYEFHSAPQKYRLMHGGSGGGKSMGLVWDAVGKSLSIEKANILILRKSMSASEKAGIEQLFFDTVPKELYKKYDSQKHIFFMNTGTRIQFGYISNDNDLLQYQGGEYVHVYFDELTHFTYRHWDFMKSRNRCREKFDLNGNPVIPGMTGACNPYGPGTQWVKALWIDKKLPAGVEDLKYNPNDYFEIHSTVADNFVYATDLNYRNNLESMTDPTMRAAFALGSWDTKAGQMFSNFERSRHVKSYEQIIWQPWQPKWIGCDWGFAHITCAIWFTLALKRDLLTGQNHQVVVAYRELVTSQKNEIELADLICKASIDREGNREKISAIFFSPERFNRQNSQNTIADSFGSALADGGLPYPSRANNDRIGGWRLIYTQFDTEFLIIQDSCTEVLDSIPRLMRDQKNIEDAVKTGDEPFLDICEALRYGLMSYFDSRSKPKALELQELLSSKTTPQAKHMAHLRFQEQQGQNRNKLSRIGCIPSWRDRFRRAVR
jgi:PBSX family phage terminase large subunit